VTLTGDAEWANLPAVPVEFGSAAFTPDGEHLVASSVDGSTTVWDPATGKPVRTLDPHDPAARSPDPDVFAIDRLLDEPSGSDVRAIDVSPDGRMIATASADGMTRVWDAATGRQVIVGPVELARDVGWSPDGDLLATGGFEQGRGVVSIIDRTGRSVAVLWDEPDVEVLSVDFSPDGRFLATSRARASRFDPDVPGVAIWDWERHDIVATLETSAHRAVFDPSGTRLVTTSATDGVAKVWDVQSRERVATLAGHEGTVYDATYSPDGSTIATTGLEGTVRLWDAESGEQTLVLRGHEGPVSSVAVSPDGSKLASVSADGVVRVWALDLDDLVEIAKRELTRNLTDAECRQYLHLDRCPQG
jgi:WD40 repeat protein